MAFRASRPLRSGMFPINKEYDYWYWFRDNTWAHYRDRDHPFAIGGLALVMYGMYKMFCYNSEYRWTTGTKVLEWEGLAEYRLGLKPSRPGYGGKVVEPHLLPPDHPRNGGRFNADPNRMDNRPE
eukprot:TRINITY_DN10914_c0_g1_i1.p1 TRINITY_DN10914_c0_g1~~TRINITY_DN10914_c0_g1_i1.p1  ORF type:complete len:125 (+),score=13.05 TRINITY_DN10914_c0_g1_i1:39-413(+)